MQDQVLKYKKGDLINVEKSMNFGQKVSGHYVQGHVDTTGKVKFIKKIGKTWLVDFTLSQKFLKMLLKNFDLYKWSFFNNFKNYKEWISNNYYSSHFKINKSFEIRKR